jgi:tetratricopeptide (TPR) repeat protein
VAKFGAKKAEDPAVLLLRGEYGAAAEAIRAQLKHDPSDLRLRNQLGDALAGARRTSEALAEYQMLAACYADDGFTAKALAIWKKMARLAPGDEGLLHRIAACQGERGERRSAPPAKEVPAGATEPAIDGAAEPPLFPEFLPAELAAVAGHLEHRRFADRERIVAEGAPGDAFYIIAEGSVGVTVRSPRGAEIALATLGAGEFFGEVAVIKGRKRTATITAAGPCEVLELTRADLEKVVATHPRVRPVLEEFIHRRAERTVDAIVEARRAGRG